MSRWNFEGQPNAGINPEGTLEPRPTFPTPKPRVRRGTLETRENGEVVFRLPQYYSGTLDIRNVKAGGLRERGISLLGDVSGNSRKRITDLDRKP